MTNILSRLSVLSGIGASQDSGLTDSQQHRNVISHLFQQCGISFRMKCCTSRSPVQTLEMVYQNCTIYLVHHGGQGEGIGFALAGQRTDYCKAAGAVVALISQDQRGAPPGLFAPALGIEVYPRNVTCPRHIAGYHSTASLP